MIEQFVYEYAELAAKERIFPARIGKDHSILYHSTTSVSEAGIDAQGFAPPQTWFRETAMRSLQYTEREWAGGDQARNLRRAGGPSAEALQILPRQYQYGLVYAVRFFDSDIPNLSYIARDGILHRGALPPDRIVAKARLLLGSRMAPRRDDIGRMLSWCEGPFGSRIRSNLEPSQ